MVSSIRNRGAFVRDSVEVFFTEVHDIHSSGVGLPELSYYPALKTLLDEVGKGMRPKVRAVMHLSNRGAGLPDGGLFTTNHLKSGIDQLTLDGSVPWRCALEVKRPSVDIRNWQSWPDADQLRRYVAAYGLVLATNLWDWVLYEVGPDGQPRQLEDCPLASSEAWFWKHLEQPRTYGQKVSEGLREFLWRVMLHQAPLIDPKDVAKFLASYARTARLRLESRRKLPALSQVRSQLEEALGLEFEGDKGEHFFRSTLVQTLFYGMFASWVLWTKEQSTTRAGLDGRFEWETASITLHVPMVAELFYQFSKPGTLRDLHIDEVMEWAETVLNRVDRGAFFRRFREQHAVQYFYEPFLEAFDPELRKELGVWYTPDEVVKYMVARVDRALKEDLGVADGLADPSVFVLDPCCGTGAYLVEVLRTIDQTLAAKGADALTRSEVKQAAMKRVVGFEIMPAPFVVAHLQLGILLTGLGVPLQGSEERAAVYLTNALTGWGRDSEIGGDDRIQSRAARVAQLFQEFAQERNAADHIKRGERILVVIGNPPYNSYAGTSPAEEGGLVDPYKEGLVREWKIKKFNLDELYVRFFRLAERQIAERTGKGVVCLISNFSWLADPSFVVMRKRLLSEFDHLWIDNLNGDSRETGKRTPDGLPDPSVFSTEQNREGIRVGTAVSLMVRTSPRTIPPSVKYRDFWGANKRADLVASLAEDDPDRRYTVVVPSATDRFSLRPRHIEQAYLDWPNLTDLGEIQPINGLMEKRGGALFDSDPVALESRMRTYYDSAAEWADLVSLGTGLTRDAASFDARAVRARVLDTEEYRQDRLVRYSVRPFDERWAYYTAVPALWNRARPTLFAQAGEGSAFLYSRPAGVASPEGVPISLTSALGDNDALRGHAYYFSFMLAESTSDELALVHEERANVSPRMREYLTAVARSCTSERTAAGLTWLHALAIGQSPAYLSDHADGVKADWPRIPLPDTEAAILKSAGIGARVARLLDPQSPVFVPTDDPTLLLSVGILSTTDRRQLDPSVDLGVTARWGIAGKDGITMPSTGRADERDYTDDELESIAERARMLGMSAETAVALLGGTCLDVYLNDRAYWRCVPLGVWRYTVGGYQVIKKWLSYRERSLLGRDLTVEEARYVTDMIRRIAELVLMQPALDENYRAVRASTWDWQASGRP